MKPALRLTFLAFSVALVLQSCSGEGAVNDGKMSTYEDSLNYCLGAAAAEVFAADSIEVRDEALKAGIASVIHPGGEQVMLKDDIDSLNFNKGRSIAKSLMNKKYQINETAFMNGCQEGRAGKTQISKEAIQRYVGAHPDIQLRDPAIQATKNKIKGMRFLAANATAQGVIQTPSGLQYRMITEGTGKSPTLDNKVTCHYTGTLIDGTKFDSSVDRGQPATFPLRGVIQGWQEALPLMKEGGKMECWIPSEMAYGNQAPPNIGPNQVLKFEIELIKVEEGAPQPPPQMMPR